jgi:hypothetical protein
LKKEDKDKIHNMAISRYGKTPHIPFLNIPDMIETLPVKYTEDITVELSNSEFTKKFTTMLETVSRKKFTLGTKRKIANEVTKVGSIIKGIVDAVKENGKEENDGDIKTITH